MILGILKDFLSIFYPVRQMSIVTVFSLIMGLVSLWKIIQQKRWKYRENGILKSIPEDSPEAWATKSTLGKIGREHGGHVQGLKHVIKSEGLFGWKKVIEVTYPIQEKAEQK